MAATQPSAARLARGLLAQGSLWRNATVSLQAIPATAISIPMDSVQLMNQHIQEMESTVNDINTNTPLSRQAWNTSWMARRSTAATALLEANTSLVHSFQRFIPAAVAALQWLDAAILCPQQVQVEGERLELFTLV